MCGQGMSLGMPGSLGDVMSAQSLEGMLQGMSLDLGTFGDSVPAEDGSMKIPMSPAQRIKRDRAFSVGSLGRSLDGRGRSGSGNFLPGSLAGSQLAPPMQRMRQGPGPGSIPQAPLGVSADADLDFFDTAGI